jgi:hypothetical protein
MRAAIDRVVGRTVATVLAMVGEAMKRALRGGG